MKQKQVINGCQAPVLGKVSHSGDLRGFVAAHSIITFIIIIIIEEAEGTVKQKQVIHGCLAPVLGKGWSHS